MCHSVCAFCRRVVACTNGSVQLCALRRDAASWAPAKEQWRTRSSAGRRRHPRPARLLTKPHGFYNICPIKMAAYGATTRLRVWGVTAALAVARVASAASSTRCPPSPARGTRCRGTPSHVTLRAAALPISLRAATSLPGGARCPCARVARRLPRGRLLRPAGSPAPDRGGGLGEAARGGSPGTRHPGGKAVNRVLGRRGSVWADRFHRERLVQPACSSQRAGLRPAELAEARSGRSGARRRARRLRGSRVGGLRRPQR